MLTIHEFWKRLVCIGTVYVSKNVTFEHTSDLHVPYGSCCRCNFHANCSHQMLFKVFVPRSTIQISRFMSH